MDTNPQADIESQLDRWRAFVLEHGDSETRITAAVEQQLRDHTATLSAAGLSAEEAFLVALTRVARTDAATAALVREHPDALWALPELSAGDAGVVDGLQPGAGQAGDRAQSVDESGSGHAGATTEFLVALGLAVAAAVAFKIPELFGYSLQGAGADFYARNLSVLVLPFLSAYFIWKRGLSPRGIAGLASVFVAGAVFANAYPFVRGGSTEVLSAIHLPIVLWLAVGVAYAGGDWRSDARRMEYVRFTGEWLITYALIAAGGGVLIAMTIGVFGAIGLDAEAFMTTWVLPCGAAGAVIVAAWLVETRRNLVGGMAPMLARVFTPLFAIMLAATLVGVISTRGVINVEREVLILFDLLLVVVLALLLYAISARDERAGSGVFDWIQLVLVACALAVDVFALVNIAGRLSEYGFSANRTAAIGLNLILLVNLAWSAYLQTGFLRSRREFAAVERWQMCYLPVYALWAAIVVIAFPPLFGFA